MRKAIYFLKSLLPFFFLCKMQTFYLYFSSVTLESATLFFNCVFPSTHMYPDIIS